MRGDDGRAIQGAVDVRLVRRGPLSLVGETYQTGMEQTAIERAEVELADENRHVDVRGEMDVGGRAFVVVEADDVAILGRCPARRIVEVAEATTQV